MIETARERLRVMETARDRLRVMETARERLRVKELCVCLRDAHAQMILRAV